MSSTCAMFHLGKVSSSKYHLLKKLTLSYLLMFHFVWHIFLSVSVRISKRKASLALKNGWAKGRKSKPFNSLWFFSKAVLNLQLSVVRFLGEGPGSRFEVRPRNALQGLLLFRREEMQIRQDRCLHTSSWFEAWPENDGRCPGTWLPCKRVAR